MNEIYTINTEHNIKPDQPWLAPLAGWSDLAFRLLCREYGAKVCCTEMISAKGLIYSQPATRELLATNADDNPLVVQLFGEDPQSMEQAVVILIKQGFRNFDCNMGCSVPKVIKTGAGAALLKEQERAVAVAKAMLKAGVDSGMAVKFGFKLRLGFLGEQTHVYKDLSLALIEAGAAWLTLHPRTAKQGFAGTANWQAIADLVSLSAVPIIASGDLWTAQDGIACIRETGASTVMYARGALRDPMIFSKHRKLLANEAIDNEDKEALHACIMRHADLAKQYCVPKVALLKMRTSIPRYVRNYVGVSSLRQAIINCHTWEDFDKIINDFFA